VTTPDIDSVPPGTAADKPDCDEGAAWSPQAEAVRRLDEAEAGRALDVFLSPFKGGEAMCFSGACGDAWDNRLAPADPSAVFSTIRSLDRPGATVYWGLNPVAASLRLGGGKRDVVAEDALRRVWFYVDVDRLKTKDDRKLSATDAEHDAALAAAETLAEGLGKDGWPDPVATDSGNGAGLFYRIDLPNDRETQTLLSGALQALDARLQAALGDKRPDVDLTTHNADRVAKLPGSWARKGPDTPDRPHRPCRLLRAPEALAVVTAEQLKALASSAPSCRPASPGRPFSVRAAGASEGAWALSAMEREVGRMACTRPGRLNRQLRDSGYALGNLVGAGLLDEGEVFRALLAAARMAGADDPRKDEDTLRRAIEDGKTNPRTPPETNGPPARHSVPLPYRLGTDTESARLFPDPVPLPDLVGDPEGDALWHRYLYRGEVTMLTALWKLGKTTLVAHALRAFEAGGTFLGQKISKARVLYVSEEGKSLWLKRRDALGIKGHVEMMLRPFLGKPSFAEWFVFIDHLAGLVRRRGYDLVILDPLASLSPVTKENDAAETQAALMPLRKLGDQVAVLVIHHNRKSDGEEATAARGSGALGGFVDTIIEARRYEGSTNDRRRVLKSYGRHDESNAEVVIELTERDEYRVHGDRSAVRELALARAVQGLLPAAAPGLSFDDIMEGWPEAKKPRRNDLSAVLAAGAARRWWTKAGKGKRGDPFTYLREADSVSVPSLYEAGTDTEPPSSPWRCTATG
jgi:hypothetical protein